MRRLLTVGFMLCVTLHFGGGSCFAATRYEQLRSVVDHNTGFAHFRRGMNSGTIDALRRSVTERDIPVLVQMLHDPDRITRMTAANVLVKMGSRADAELDKVLSTADADLAEIIRDARSFQPGPPATPSPTRRPSGR